MERSSTKNIFIAFILNLFFSIFELIGGILTNSMSVMADSIHDFGDAISILTSLILEKYSTKQPNQDYTYGYLRYSTFGALITCTILLVGSILMLVNAVKRIFNPVVVNYDGMLILSIIGITINLIATAVTHKTSNLNEKMVSLHILEDVLGWACVLVGSIIMRVTNLHIIDPILSICVSIFILVTAIKKFKSILDILSEKKPNKINTEELKKHLLNIEKIKDIHHLHIWTIDGINNYITLHVLIDENIEIKELENIKEKIKEELKEHEINHSTIEFETKKCKNCSCKVEKNKKMQTHTHHH